MGEDDPYNPTSDSICMDVWIPGTGTETTACGDRHILQMMHQGMWYDLPSQLGSLYSLEEVTGDGWITSDGVFEPSDEPSTHTVRMNELSKVGNMEFQFRLKTASDTGYNPYLGVTGYKDNRLFLEKESRAEALVTVFNIGVLLRGLMQLLMRRGIDGMGNGELPSYGVDGRPLQRNVTHAYFLQQFQNYNIHYYPRAGVYVYPNRTVAERPDSS